MRWSDLITVGGRELWAYVVELDGGFRVRFAIDDWERIHLYRGQRVALKKDGDKADTFFFHRQ